MTAQPPPAPASPRPAHEATGVSVDADLDWADAARATSYDVYLGTSVNPPLVDNTPSSNWPLGTLSYSTTYYWKIVAKNSAGSTAGPVWSFMTDPWDLVRAQSWRGDTTTTANATCLRRTRSSWRSRRAGGTVWA